MVTENTLLVVCDTHRPSFTQDASLLDLINHIIVIDHHRRASEFIKIILPWLYLEPYASSTSKKWSLRFYNILWKRWKWSL